MLIDYEQQFRNKTSILFVFFIAEANQIRNRYSGGQRWKCGSEQGATHKIGAKHGAFHHISDGDSIPLSCSNNSFVALLRTLSIVPASIT